MRKIFAIIIALSMVLCSCSFEELSIGKPKNVKCDKLSLQCLKISADIPIENPNNIGFTVNKVSIDLSIGDVKLGTLSKNDKVKIPANSNQTYRVEYEVNPADVVKEPLTLIKAITLGGELHMKGYVKASKMLISKKFDVDYTQKLNGLKIF